MTRISSMEKQRLLISAGTITISRSVAMTFVIICLVLPWTSSATGTVGREFVFAFPPNYVQDGQPSNIGVIIQSISNTSSTIVVVRVPRKGDIFNLTLDNGSLPCQLELPVNLSRAMVSGITESTVQVTSNEDIALVAYNYKAYTMELFTVLPTRRLGQEYFVATFTEPSGGAIMISATSSPVAVAVTLNANVEFLGATYKQGEILRYNLQPYKTMQLEPMNSDIVGTHILANTSIAVTVGCLCAYVPKGIQRCDHLAEQLIPFNRWGTSYLLSPFFNRLSGYQYHVVAGRNDTRVWIDNYEIQLGEGEYYLGDVNTQIMTSIHSNNPIMVMQYSKGTDTDRRHGDPAMVVIPPREQYSTRVEFPVYTLPASGINDVYVSVTAECNSTHAIRFNDLPYHEVPWLLESDVKTHDNRYECTRWTAVEGGKYTISGITPGASEDVTFTALVHGVGNRISYLYNPGFNLEKLTCTTPSNTSSRTEVEITCESLKPRACEEENTNSSYGVVTWKKTRSSTEVFSNKLCPLDTLRAGLPVARRRCELHQRRGAYWSSVIPTDCGRRDIPISAAELADMPINASNVEAVSSVLEKLTRNMSEVDDETVSAISTVLENIIGAGSPAPEVTTSVGRTVNNLIESLGTSASGSDKLAASLSSVVRSLEEQVSLTLRDRGMFNLMEKNVNVRTMTLSMTSLSNEVLFTGGGFGSQEDINLPSASIKLPTSIFTDREDVLYTANSAGTQVRFIVFKGDTLFISEEKTPTSGNIISAAVEGRSIKGLAEPVEITFDPKENVRENDTISNQSRCVYWDFELRNGVGDWSSDGCTLSDVSSGVITCACDHLTNFAVFMDISGQHEGNKTKFHFALDILSRVGCAISITALIITIAVFLLFKRLRSSRPRRILLHLCFSLLSLYLVFLFGIDQASGSDNACIAVGALLHYFILSTMLWMAVEALNMYLLIIRVFDEEGPWFLFKAAIVVWGAPLVVVGVTAGIKADEYLHKSYCFLTPGLSFYLSVLLPIGLILLFNFVMFLLVVRRLWTANLGGNVPIEKEDKIARYQRLRVRLLNAFSISVLLGLTWVFGFLAIEDATFAFQLIFCVVNSLQGLVVFILFCVRQEDVRKSVLPHYRRLAGMLPRGTRPGTITAYSLTSRSTSRNEPDNVSRNPLRTTPILAGTYSSKMSSDSERVRMTSNNDDVHDYHE